MDKINIAVSREAQEQAKQVCGATNQKLFGYADAALRAANEKELKKLNKKKKV